MAGMADTTSSGITKWQEPDIPSKWDIIPLTQNKSAIVDSEDYDRVSQHIWCASFQHGKWYALSNSIGLPRLTYLHRFILNLNPGDPEVDHVNGDGLDCRKQNLRVATRSQNCANKPKGSSLHSKYKGVTWQKANKKWIAQIKVNGKNHYLGSFVVEEEAAKAYDKAAKEAFGEFSRTNF